MRVGIDGKCLLPPRAGVARYLEGLLAGLRELAAPECALEVISPRRRGHTLPWVLWNLQRATSRGFDAFHFPFYYPPLAPRCPVTVAVHDVLVLQHPEWFSRPFGNSIRLMLPRGARRAAAVVASSRCNAAAIAATCRVPISRIRIIPYGVDHDRFSPPAAEAVAALRARLGLQRPYLFQLGALEPRRGVDVALEAVAILRGRFPELELVLAGEQRAALPGLQPRPWLRRLGWVEDADIPGLLAGAAVVLAPSRGEGFDLPVLEALACGAAVVASDIPVHVEHFSSAIELFASGSGDGLAAAVARVLEDSSRAASLRGGGPSLAATYRWRDAARAHLDMWREVVG
jgi:glycosyltransferase involved in cell wall biosynthesis